MAGPATFGRWWIAMAASGVAAATVVLLLVVWPAWVGSWVIIAFIAGVTVAAACHPRGWYRRRSAACLGGAFAFAAVPTIDAAIELPPWMDGTFSTTSSTVVAIVLLLLCFGFAVLDLISRRPPGTSRPQTTGVGQRTQAGDAIAASGEARVQTTGRDDIDAQDQAVVVTGPNSAANVYQGPVTQNYHHDPTGMFDRVATSNTNFSEAAITPNSQFVGRNRELAELERKLAEGSVAVHHAVTADGGVGKSALAFEFAFGQRDAFDGLWFVDGSDPTTIDLHCRQILRALGQDDPPTDVPTDQLAGAVAGLLSRARHLLLLDDVCDPQWIRTFALMDPARVLVTTRLTDLPGDLVVKPMALDVLDRPDSIALLRQGREDLAEDDPGLGAIADHLGDHALALTLTAALLQRRPRPTPGDVLDRLRLAEIGDEAHLLEGVDPRSKAAGYRRGVAESLTLLLPELDGEADEASRVTRLTLACLSLLAPRDIPTELARRVVAAAGGVDADAVETDAVDEALARLAGLSVIRFENDDQTLAIHGLTQQVLRHRLGGEDESTPLNVAKRTLCRRFISIFPEDGSGYHTTREWMSVMLPHIQACAEHLPDEGETAALLGRIGYFAQHVLGKLVAARAKFEEAERICRVAYGDDHTNVALAVNNVGSTLEALGDLGGARANYEEAERIFRTACGNDHPNVATVVGNLGNILRKQGDLSGAQAKFEEAERIDREAYGDNHPAVARDVNNLGGVLNARGNLAGVRAKCAEAERIDRAVYGDGHPKVAIRVNNLGSLLHAEGDLAGARAKYEEALGILLRAYGPRGEGVVTVACNVAGVGGDPLAIAREVGGAELEAAMGEGGERVGGRAGVAVNRDAPGDG